MVKLKKLLKLPLTNENDDTRKIYFLKLMLTFGFPLSILSTALSVIAAWQEGIIASILGFCLFTASYILLHHKKLRIASTLFLITILVITLISTFLGGNIKDSSLFLIPIIIIFSGLLLEKRFFLIFSISSGLLAIATAALSWYYFHTTPLPGTFIFTSIMLIIYFSVTIIAITVLILYLEHSIKESRANEEKFRNITENLNIGIFTYTSNGKFNYVNNYFQDNFGYSKEELFSKKFIDFIHPDYKQMVTDISSSRLKGENTVDNYEVKVIYKDGSVHWTAISASKVNIQDQQLGLGSALDITKRKELEQQIIEEKDQIEKAKKLESMGLLAGGIAHDFNNLLTGILGNISLINLYLEENDTVKIKDKLFDVQLVIKRASNLTNQLLTFSKGGLLTLKVASLENIVRENTAFVLSGSNVNYSITGEENLWNVSVDTGQISQVIQNLIINADQSMPDGGKIDISLKNISLAKRSKISGVEIPEGNYVRVEIKDTGAGIPKENINKIFDPYFTTKQEGNGLGLATVYSIIEHHNGCICVESEQGEGTTFSLFFQKALNQNIEKTAGYTEIQKQGYRKDQKQNRILIMDDELLVLSVAEEIFKSMDFSVDLANDGNEVLEKIKKSILREERYNIVLLDLTIPGGMGGKETLQHILKLDPEVNAIATSGYSSDPVMANFKKYGFKGILKKPYTFDDIEKITDSCYPQRGEG